MSAAVAVLGSAYLDRILPLREVLLQLSDLGKLAGGVLGRQATADGAGLLWPEVERQVL